MYKFWKKKIIELPSWMWTISRIIPTILCPKKGNKWQILCSIVFKCNDYVGFVVLKADEWGMWLCVVYREGEEGGDEYYISR